MLSRSSPAQSEQNNNIKENKYSLVTEVKAV